MVIDLQDADNTLDKAVAESHIRLFGSSSKNLEISQDGNDTVEESDISGDEDDSDESTATKSDVSDTPDDERSENSRFDTDNHAGEPEITDRGRTRPRLLQRAVNNSVADSGSAMVDFADSDSELGSDDDGAAWAYNRQDDDDIEDEGTDGEESEGIPRWKENLASRATKTYNAHSREKRRTDWIKLIYSSSFSPKDIVSGKHQDLQSDDGNESENSDDDELFKIKVTADNEVEETWDMTKESLSTLDLQRWEDEEILDSIRHLFITGATTVGDEVADEEIFDGDMDGDFEDLEGGSDGGDIEQVQHTKDQDDSSQGHEAARAAALAAKKEVLKQKFDEQYDDPETSKLDFYDEKKEEMARQRILNNAELEGIDEDARAMVEGYRPGSYVRIELEGVPCELVQYFDPTYPVIVGGLLPVEERFGFVQARIKRHRWHAKTLKTNDPLIFSLGWRRFQTIPIYSLDDHSIRMRML